MTKERENGFYWVLLPPNHYYGPSDSCWIVARWQGEWQLPNTDWEYQDKYFKKIIEIPIPPPSK